MKIQHKVSDEIRYFILEDGEGYLPSNIGVFLTERLCVAKHGNVFTATVKRVLNITLQHPYKHQTVIAVYGDNRRLLRKSQGA